MSRRPEAAPRNHLAQETSPYLQLHASNPVDWYPWGPEALEKARREGKPIFLSVGYSTCFWCHVMERESFSDPAIAALMNASFVNIKVDREERPDLDEIYMTATQILTGQGGWPNSVFLTPDLKPFYAGTYFPPTDRYGRPGFASVLQGLARAWKERRGEVEQQAEEVAAAMRRYLEEQSKPGDAPPKGDLAEASLEALARRFDAEWGGFGTAPKFPTPSNLLLLLEMADERPEAAKMLHDTLDHMARGGIYDQLAGGFHRYSTDREWTVPHFEKMLYDNGFLLEIYAREAARTGDPEMARVARETAAFLGREMTSPEGAFLSAIDAETDGEEGAYYVWSAEEIHQLLGEEDARFLAPLYGFEGPPTFEGDRYVLRLPRPLAEEAARRHMSREELLAAIAPLGRKLLAARDERPRPATDDKVLADWNGVAITGMAEAGRLLGEPELVERAVKAARFVLREMRRGAAGGSPEKRVLLHTWRAGRGKIPAYLADYVFLVRGLLALHEATGEEEWLAAARELTEEQIRRLRDPRGGFFSAAEGDDLLCRSKEVFDGALPATNAVAALDLLELARRTGEERWRREAAAVLAAFAPLAEDHPDALRTLTIAVRRYHRAEAEMPEPPVAAGGAADLSRRALSLVTTSLEVGEAATDGWRSVTLRLHIASGWHVNAHPASEDFLVPTELEGKDLELRAVAYPAPTRMESKLAEGGLDAYEGEVALTAEVRPEGEGGTLLLRYQPCDESRCLPAVTQEIAVE